MALSFPDVEVKEIDLTGIVPGTSPTISAYAGQFNWGPIDKPILVSDENDAALVFGRPKNALASTPAEANRLSVSFLTLASYLAYANGVRVSRVANLNDTTPENNAINAVSTLAVGDTHVPLLIKNADDYEAKATLGNLGTNFAIAKYAGAMGNSIGVSAVFTANQYSSAEILPTEAFTLDKTAKTLSIPNTSTATLVDHFLVGDIVNFVFNGVTYKNRVTSVTQFVLGINPVGAQLPTFPASAQTGVVADVSKTWGYATLFNGAPSTGEFHVVVFDVDGLISGEAGTVLERFAYVSNDLDKTYPDGTPAYYKTVINNQSAYIWVGGADLATPLASTSPKGYTEQLTGGRNGSEPGIDDYILAYSVFEDKEVEISSIIAPPAMGSLANATVPSALIQNIAEVRKDVVVYLSPRYADVVNVPRQELDNVLEYRGLLPSSSYAFMDNNWKSMYDKYNNVFRWVPLCGDIAGVSARTDNELDPWHSIAGYDMGQIKNVSRLAWNVKDVEQGELYQKGINSVIKASPAGFILNGDKTLLERPSAFDRINVRKLFIVLEKSISRAAKYSLFKFNDEFTRNRFVSIVEPFLRDVKGRRGVTDYKVVCDSSNNTPTVIDSNRFIGDIYIKPNRSINFITLNFINTPTGVAFEEIVGRF